MSATSTVVAQRVAATYQKHAVDQTTAQARAQYCRGEYDHQKSFHDDLFRILWRVCGLAAGTFLTVLIVGSVVRIKRFAKIVTARKSSTP
jgi:hypothetical protein